MRGESKQFLDLAGQPVLLRALRPFLEHEAVRSVVVALPAAEVEEAPSWLTELDERVAIVVGGDNRRDSIWAGIQILAQDLDVVVVHDGARPLVSSAVISRCIQLAAGGVGAIAGFPATDTIKEVDDSGSVTRTPERERLWHAQTPQAFPAAQIVAAYVRAVQEDWPATDDAGLVERNGGAVTMVESPSTNLKITRPEDVAVAELILERETLEQ